MQLLQSRKAQNLLLIFLGISGLVSFFVLYPSVHPHSVIELQHSREEIVSKSDSILHSWNIQSAEFTSKTTLITQNTVLDSLQRKWGKEHFRQNLLQEEKPLTDMLIFWSVPKFSVSEDAGNHVLTLDLNTKGDIVSFKASGEFIRQQNPTNRSAIHFVLDNSGYNFSSDFGDSLISALVDYQQLGEDARNEAKALQIINRLRSFQSNEGDEYDHTNIWELSEFYLQQSVWKDFELNRDSVITNEADGYRYASVYLSGELPIEGISINLKVEVLPAGSLKSISADIQPQVSPSESSNEVAQIVIILVIVFFFLWLLVIFYLRIKAKAIDTKPAIIVAVLTGFIAPACFALFLAKESQINISAVSFTNIIGILILMAIFGAISAVLFFVLTAVSDSVTRQYWPEKLKTWDLIRSGIFKNKPVGWVIIHGIAIGGFMAGVLTLLMLTFSGMRISTELTLISDTYYLSPLANLLFSFFMVLLIVVIVYLLVGNQIVGLTKKKWLIPVFSSIIFGALTLIPASLNPWPYEVGANLVLGFILGVFYIRYDFLTTTLAAFTFVNLLLTEEGFLIGNSPDSGVFYFFIGLLATSLIAATYLVIKGTEREELPEYVPAYIEDQAMELRLRQELSIARLVQKTFLPSQIKRLPGIDIAGTCIPALETGGDYYDMISLGQSRMAVTIGDVSGKGIRAAFYMTFVKGVLHSLSSLILSPVELLNQLNRLFNENATRGTFISMIYGILEADKRQFTFARAGHNPMLVVRKTGNVEWLQPKGIGIGVTKGDTFLGGIEESVLKIKEGDIIVLYTDGITEMLDSGHRFYGEERLENLVKKIHPKSSSEILKIIIDDVNEFKGLEKQHDDMTLVVIKADSSVSV